MKRFSVVVHYTVAPGRTDPVVVDVLAGAWRQGHRFSVWGGSSLSVGVEVRAMGEADAVSVVDDAVRAFWPQVGAGALTQVHALAQPLYARVGAGVVTEMTSRVLDDPPPWSRRRSRRGSGGPIDPFDEGPGGTAGVREPRRPRTPPGHLSAALDVPTG